MPSLIDIRRRIRSVKNMQQITKAMKMVSAAKLRRAQERALASRPYARIMQRMLSNIAAASVGSEEVTELPLLPGARRKTDSAHCRFERHRSGRRVQRESAARRAEVSRRTQRCRSSKSKPSAASRAIISSKRKLNVSGEYVGIVEKPKIEQAREIAAKMIEALQQSRSRRRLSRRQRIQERDGAESGSEKDFARGVAGGRRRTDRLHLGTIAQRNTKRSAAALCGDVHLPRDARISLGLSCRSHGRHGCRQLQRRRCDPNPDFEFEPRAASQHHA